MKLPPAFSLALVLVTSSGAAELPHVSGVRSASGQFIVHLDERHTPFFQLPISEGTNHIRLDPTLVTVSAERVRQHLYRELRSAAPWSGTIHLVLRPAISKEDPVTIISEQFRDRWRYWVRLPDVIRRDRFVRVMVDVLLLEMANRGPAGRSPEIPLWLSEGMTARLLASRQLELILPPPKASANGRPSSPWVAETIRWQPLDRAHFHLQTNAPLSMEGLSWTSPAHLQGDAAMVYRHCAHLFVAELLQLPDGPDALRRFVEQLPQNYNWQISFLAAFSEHFSGLLDLEKWWSLQVAHFTGRDLHSAWPLEDSWEKLEEVLRFPVEVRMATDDLPLHAEVKLQTIISDWDYARQGRTLKITVQELDLLRLRVASELVPIVDGYRVTLVDYLRDRNKTGLPLMKGANRQPSLARVARKALRELDALDAEFARLRPIDESDGVIAHAPAEMTSD